MKTRFYSALTILSALVVGALLIGGFLRAKPNLSPAVKFLHEERDRQARLDAFIERDDELKAEEKDFTPGWIGICTAHKLSLLRDSGHGKPGCGEAPAATQATAQTAPPVPHPDAKKPPAKEK